MIEALAAALIAQSYGAVCLRDGDTITGEFRYVESRHPNGTSLRYGFIKTAEPVCVVGELSDSPASRLVEGQWVQISWAETQIGEPVPGDQVVVSADCFEPMTAWHLGDIICINARLLSREPM